MYDIPIRIVAAFQCVRKSWAQLHAGEVKLMPQFPKNCVPLLRAILHFFHCKMLDRNDPCLGTEGHLHQFTRCIHRNCDGFLINGIFWSVLTWCTSRQIHWEITSDGFIQRAWRSSGWIDRRGACQWQVRRVVSIVMT